MIPFHRRSMLFPFTLSLVVVNLVFPTALHSQIVDPYQEGYQKPPELVEDILTRNAHADRLDALSPNLDLFFIPVREEFTTLELMAQRTLRLGMLEITPDSNREWRLSTYGIQGLRLYSLSQQRFWEAQLPENALVSEMTWSPNGEKIALLLHLPGQSSRVWTIDALTGAASQFSNAEVMLTLTGRSEFGRGDNPPSRGLQWLSNDSVLTLIVPAGRGPEPGENPIPTSPLIQRTRDKATPNPTYPFLLRTEVDQQLFRYYTMSQMAILREGQAARPIGEPAMFDEVSVSPDGLHILAERIVEPLSTITSFTNFGTELAVYDLEGRSLSTIRKVPLQEGSSRDGGPRPEDDLPREVAWRPDGKGLFFLWKEPKPEKKEEGAGAEENGAENDRADRLMTLGPPFDPAGAVTIHSSKDKMSRAAFSSAGEFAFATLDKKNGKAKRQWIALDLRSGTPEVRALTDDFDPEDPLKLPGDLMMGRNSNGIAFARVSSDGVSAFLSGNGYQEDFAPQPFIDRVEIASGSKARLFESAADSFETPEVPLDPDLQRMIVRRQALEMFPNDYLWGQEGTLTKLTENNNPFPEIGGARRVDFEYKRRDGLTGYGRITLPPGYQEGTRVPAVFWTYPREYTSFADYKREAIRSRNRNAYPQLNYRNASDIWLTQGYAVVEPDIPIIGKGNQYNNNYVANLVDSMYAAIRKVDELGFVDVDRLGHGGHSYGAFATANILSHSPFFKAGIAGDGAYNRTLTPMTFQRERRLIWEANDIYLEMSPFFQADRMNTPLLMYHGAADNNTGTFLIQSERYLQALTGLGKNAVLYIYPFESHGPRCIETYFDLWSRWIAWFDKYVQNSGMEGKDGAEVK